MGDLKKMLGEVGSLYGYDTNLTEQEGIADIYPEGYVPPTNPLATKDSSLHYYEKLYKPGISVRGFDWSKITDADEREEAIKVIDNFVLYKDGVNGLPPRQGSELDPSKYVFPGYSDPTFTSFNYTSKLGNRYADKIRELKKENKL